MAPAEWRLPSCDGGLQELDKRKNEGIVNSFPALTSAPGLASRDDAAEEDSPQ
jgi:hypothetical protein